MDLAWSARYMQPPPLLQPDVSAQFVAGLGEKIIELEKAFSSSNPAERDAAKARRKQLREVQRFVADKQNSLEDKIAHVQAKYTQQVRALARQRPTCGSKGCTWL